MCIKTEKNVPYIRSIKIIKIIFKYSLKIFFGSHLAVFRDHSWKMGDHMGC